MKKRMAILLILLLVMIISIGAISAADTNDTSLGAVSDTDIATTSVAVEQEDNATSFYNDDGIDVNDDNQKEGGASSNLGNDVLSVSDDDLLGENPNFYYRGKWYGDLDDAVDDAEDYGGTIYLRGNAWGYDSAERRISIDTGVSITFEPYSSSDTVIFDGQNQEHWFFVLNDNNAYVTFNRITFRNGGDSFQGGAIEVDEGHLILNDCTFDNNIALTNLAGGFGWGGAIYLDSDKCTLIANNCKFINNEARGGGGAVCIQGDGSTATFNNCYFSDNTAPKGNDVYDKDGGSHTFSNCVFKGSGSIDFEVDAPEKSVTITPKDVADDANYAVLYKNGVEYDRTPCNDWDTVTFDHLESGTYTIYMAKGWEKRYEYSGTTLRRSFTSGS